MPEQAPSTIAQARATRRSEIESIGGGPLGAGPYYVRVTAMEAARRPCDSGHALVDRSVAHLVRLFVLLAGDVLERVARERLEQPAGLVEERLQPLGLDLVGALQL